MPRLRLDQPGIQYVVDPLRVPGLIPNHDLAEGSCGQPVWSTMQVKDYGGWYPLLLVGLAVATVLVLGFSGMVLPD